MQDADPTRTRPPNVHGCCEPRTARGPAGASSCALDLTLRRFAFDIAAPVWQKRSLVSGAEQQLSLTRPANAGAQKTEFRSVKCLMKQLMCLLGAALFSIPRPGQSAETAQARLWCDSLRFQRGYDQHGLYTLDFTTLSVGINGELTWDFVSANYEYSAYLELTDYTFGDTLQGVIEVDLPPVLDVNNDGFDDFFEVAMPVSTVSSSGEYEFQIYGAGTCTATWSRAAGSKNGTCAITMRLDGFTPTTFTHSFEVIEYAGPLTYTPGNTNVVADLVVTQTGNSNNVIQGPCQFVKVASDPYNDLTISDGVWTNAALQSLSYAEDTGGDLFRYPGWPTNYYGWLVFQDGDPYTGEADYVYWNLSIDDANDADHDTIPDFSDDPQTTAPRQPKLTLALSPDHVLLTIAGDVGRLHEVQQLADLSSTNWQPVKSVMLTNDPQTVSLPLPPGNTLFWRVRAQ